MGGKKVHFSDDKHSPTAGWQDAYEDVDLLGPRPIVYDFYLARLKLAAGAKPPLSRSQYERLMKKHYDLKARTARKGRTRGISREMAEIAEKCLLDLKPSEEDMVT